MRRQWQRWKGRMAPVLWAVVATAAWPGAPVAQAIDPNLWGVDNRVLTLARAGNTLYVGGAFMSVGPQTGGGVPVGLRDGLAVERYPRVAGEVKTVVPDGAGGWYVGGSFVGVGGLPRSNLAHILFDGRVSPWHPDPDGDVLTLVVHDGTLYAGGHFGHVAGQWRVSLCAFDLATGELTSWDPGFVEPWYSLRYVAAILIHEDTAYVGGAFSSIGGAPRTCLAAVDRHTGHALPWNPISEGEIECLAAHGDVLYVGGYFVRIADRYQRYLASFDMETGQLTSRQIRVDRVPVDCRCDGGPYVGVLVRHGNRLYVGGSFTSIGGRPRGGLAAVDLRSGEVTDWDPRLSFGEYWPSAYCHVAVVHGTTVYVGGSFSGLGGRYQVYLGALDAATGEPTDWVPLPNGQVNALAITDLAEERDRDRSAARSEDDRERGNGETMYVGGTFTSLGPLVRRTGLAAFDLVSGKVLPWDPEPNGLVHSLVIGGNTMYVGGDFTAVGGQPRNHVAALDATGRATAWNPGVDGSDWLGVNGSVWSLALGNGALYAGGSFSSAGGLSRRNLAAFDTLGGAVTPWNPGANDLVYSVAVGRDAVCAAGWFTRVGGQAHWTLAALDPVTGSSKPWDVHCDGIVLTLLASDNTLYAGGVFDHMGGAARENVAAINMTTGIVTPWNPDVEIPPTVVRVQSLAADASAIYIGGEFATVGGVERSNLAAVDRVTGALLPWDPAPNPDGLVWALAAYGDAVYAGGGFSRMGLSAVNGLAAISPAIAIKYKRALPLSVDPVPQGLVTCSVQPNPIQALGLVRFRLPVAATVSLTVYDLQGRCVGTLLNHEARPAGEYPVAVRTEGWPEGTYFMRLEAGGLATTEKFVVVR
jgi:beta-propeller uncharacterized protein DUF5122